MPADEELALLCSAALLLTCQSASYGLHSAGCLSQLISAQYLDLHALVYRWLAPEVVTHQQYSKASDVYSFGVILWELLTWKLPWEDLGPFQVGLRVNSLLGCCATCCKGGKRAAWHASLRADRP